MTTGPAEPAVVAWSAYQARTEGLANELRGTAHFVVRERWGRRSLLVGPRYALNAVRTWRLLKRANPAFVVVVAPPVFASMIVAVWCNRRRRPFAIDCHTEVLNSAAWRWALPAQRWAAKRAAAVTFHTLEDAQRASTWTDRTLFLPDGPDAIDAGERRTGQTRGRKRVVVAGSLDRLEPVDQEVEMARLLPEIDVVLTGDLSNVPPELRLRAPRNLTFTGWLPHQRFMQELAAADAVAAFTLDPRQMTRAAFEAVGLGRALVLSDFAGLRHRFRDGVIYSGNDARSMATNIRHTLANQAQFEEAACRISQQLRAQHADGMQRLRRVLNQEQDTLGRGAPRRLLMITQHPYPWNPTLRRNVDALLETGAHLDLICTLWEPRPADEPLHSNLRIHTIPIEHRRNHPGRYVLEYVAFFLRSWLKVATLSLRRRFDAVQVDNVPDFLFFAAGPARLRGARVVFFMYELMPEMTMARLHLGDRHPLIRLIRALERAAIRRADAVVVVNEACRRTLVARGAAQSKLTVVPNTQPARPLPARRARRHPTLVTHSTLIQRYGIDVAVRALKDLRLSWPDLSLLILGEGEAEAALHQLAQSLGVSEHVDFRGFLPWAEAMAEISTCTVGIVPVIADGYGELLLPNKLLDYAALGVPAVCSRLPAVEDYFPNDSVAYFKPGDASALASQVDRLLKDRSAAEQQAKRARAVAVSIGWETVRTQYLDIMAVPNKEHRGRGAD